MQEHFFILILNYTFFLWGLLILKSATSQIQHSLLIARSMRANRSWVGVNLGMIISMHAPLLPHKGSTQAVDKFHSQKSTKKNFTLQSFKSKTSRQMENIQQFQ